MTSIENKNDVVNQLTELFLSEIKSNSVEANSSEAYKSLKDRHSKIKDILFEYNSKNEMKDDFLIIDLFYLLEQKAIEHLQQAWSIGQTTDLEITKKSIEKLFGDNKLPNFDQLLSNVKITQANIKKTAIEENIKKRQSNGGAVSAERRENCRLFLIEKFDIGVKEGRYNPFTFFQDDNANGLNELRIEFLDFARRKQGNVYRGKNTIKPKEILFEHVNKQYLNKKN